MNRKELAQAIPPAYTEWIGRQLMDAIGVKRCQQALAETATFFGKPTQQPLLTVEGATSAPI